MRYRCNCGFSLLELIVVMALAGLAFTLAAVSISRSYEKTVLRQDAARIQRVLRHAHERALMDRAPVAFVADEDAGTYWLERGGTVLGTVQRVDEALRVQGDPVVFLPTGNGTGGLITLADITNERGYAIEVDPVTGQAAVSRL